MAAQDKLKIIPYYTGVETLEDAIRLPMARKLLWLEILFNDELNWKGRLDVKEIKESYEKACDWYGSFKTIIEGHTKRKPLDEGKGRIDYREYRRFMEALNFVSTHS